MKKLIVIITALMFVFAIQASFVAAKASEASLQDKKVYSSATLEDDFRDDRVIVVLTRKATLRFLSYTAENFASIGCSRVEDLTVESVDYVQRQLANPDTEDKKLINVEEFRRILLLELNEKSKENVLDAIRILEKREDIRYAYPDYIYSICSIPNDEFYSYGNQWGLNGTYGIRAPSAWNKTINTNSVTVGILDTGIDASHPDLVNRISTKQGLHRDLTVPSPHPNGMPSLLSPVNDPHGHGTHVAGIIGAQMDNTIGIAGVYGNVELAALRVFDAGGFGSFTSLMRAVNFAQIMNITILNYSGGGEVFDQNLLDALTNYEGLLVCSAGNNDRNTDITPFYPANHNFLPNVISVGAIKSNGMRPTSADWGTAIDGNPQGSNWGITTVDLFAPGDNILSTFPTDLCTNGLCGGGYGHADNGYHYLSGTSMAAPYVTGVAALILSQYPDISPADIKIAIMEGVDPFSSNLCVSGGRLNANRALAIWGCNDSQSGLHNFKTLHGTEVMQDQIGWTTSSLSSSQYDNYHFDFCTDCGYIAEQHTLLMPWDSGMQPDHDYHTYKCASCPSWYYGDVPHVKITTFDIPDSYGASITHTTYCAYCPYQVTHNLSRNIYTDPYNSDGHMFYCNTCTDISVLGDHIYWPSYVSSGGHTMQCFLCSYYTAGPHTVTYDYNYNGHSGLCSECNYNAAGPHSYDAAGACTTCGFEQCTTHTFSYAYQSMSLHTRTCSDCGYSDTVSHSHNGFNKDIYGHNASCQYCNYFMIGANHNFVDGFCSVCGFCASDTHSYSYSIDYSNGNHIKTCTVCNYSSVENHYYTVFTPSGDMHISYCVCGYLGVFSHSHNGYVGSSSGHTASCKDCNYLMVAGPHSSGSCVPVSNGHTGTCSICNYDMTGPHSYGSNGICYFCGYNSNGSSSAGNSTQSAILLALIPEKIDYGSQDYYTTQ